MVVRLYEGRILPLKFCPLLYAMLRQNLRALGAGTLLGLPNTNSFVCRLFVILSMFQLCVLRRKLQIRCILLAPSLLAP